MWNWLILLAVAVLPELSLPELSPPELPPDALLIQEGTASFYGRRFHMGKTSSGEIFHMDSLTAAHKTLPFGTMVKVSRADNGDFVWVRINDRLPRYSKRIIDLSRKAATKLELLGDGITRVKIEVQNLEELNRLIEYYKDGKPNSLRLRPVDLGLPIEEKEIDSSISRNF